MPLGMTIYVRTKEVILFANDDNSDDNDIFYQTDGTNSNASSILAMD